MRLNLKVALMASAGIGMGFLAACSDSATAPKSSSKFVPEVNLAVGDDTDPTAVATLIKICKIGNASGTFTITDVGNGSGGSGNPTIIDDNAGIAGNQKTMTPGPDADPNCVVAVVDEGNATNSVGDFFTVTEAVGAGVTTETTCTLNGGAVLDCPTQFFINTAHGWTILVRNTFTPPPLAICDFITFGRLVVEVGGKKVVISGNAGGNNADNSIKNEFHIDANGVDNHVADAITYGPITSGPLFGPAFANSRIVTGIAKNGVAVELRLWDGGEPGKGTDMVYVKLGTPGTVLLGPVFIDQGNMQYHSNCRGPKK